MEDARGYYGYGYDWIWIIVIILILICLCPGLFGSGGYCK